MPFMSLEPRNPGRLVGSDAGCQSRCCEIETSARPTFFPAFDKSQSDKRHSSSNNGLSVYVENQSSAWNVCYVEYWCEKARNHIVGEYCDMAEYFLKRR